MGVGKPPFICIVAKQSEVGWDFLTDFGAKITDFLALFLNYSKRTQYMETKLTHNTNQCLCFSLILSVK